MFVAVGFSDNPDSRAAGLVAVREARKRAKLAGRAGPCTMVLLFSTARHDAVQLRSSVAEAVGHGVPIVGGAMVGVLTNDNLGYAGDQVALALFWLDTVQCQYFAQPGLNDCERKVGQLLGERLVEAGVTENSPVALFYDAIDRSHGNMRMAMAGYLLEGLVKSLNFIPDLVGGGFQGDFVATATRQWTGDGVGRHQAVALAFSDNVRMDHTIMHGCRPATRYFTVTKSEGQVIYEIDGQPALAFIDTLLNGAVPVESYPFFLLLGMNRGDKWGKFEEESYVSRLCLGIDKEQSSLIMFEPDMVPGTEFQVMYRSFEHDYMIPRIDSLFDGLQGRKPVLALYIDCAGRAAGYGGLELEDGLAVQKAVAGRVPLLGVYSGVEIAPVEGRPRGLDWTGVFCLFSIAE